MSKRVLIIDDDPDILEIMQEALKYEGFEAVTSMVGDNVQDLIRNNNVDLLIIDYLLRGINGGEICHQVKASPETCHLPVILFSAHPKVFHSLGNYGCDAFIPKPFNLADMFGQITQLLHCKSNEYFIN